MYRRMHEGDNARLGRPARHFPSRHLQITMTMERGRHLSLQIAADASFHRFCVPCYVQEEQDQAVLARKQMNSDQWKRENFFTPATRSLMQRVCVITG